MSARDHARRLKALERASRRLPDPTRPVVLTSDEQRRRLIELADIARRRVAGELPMPPRAPMTPEEIEESRRKLARINELAEIARRRVEAGRLAAGLGRAPSPQTGRTPGS